MILIIQIGLLLSNIIVALKNYNAGIITFLILILTVPPIKFGGLEIDYFMISICSLLALRVFFYKKKIVISKCNLYWFIYFVILIFSTLISINKYSSSKLLIISMIGFILRILLLNLILDTRLKLKEYLYIVKVVVVVNLIISVIQILIPQSVNMFYNLYYTSGLTPLEEVMNRGYFSRAYGTFATPVRLGVFSLFSTTIFLFLGNKNNTFKANYKFVIISTILGVLAMSKSAIVGIPIILMIFIIIRLLTFENKINIKKMFNGILSAFGMYLVISFIINIMNNKGLSIIWYLEKLKNPLEVLTTRYATNDGILINTMEVIKENIILGVGKTSVKGEFLGDSMYSTILHEVGIVGMGIIIVMFISLIRDTKREIKSVVFVITISFFLAGIGSNVIFDEIGILILGLIYCLNENITNYNI